MKPDSKVHFDWQGSEFEGTIEKEYENSFLINVTNPNFELKEKYMGRIIISKKVCNPINNV
ncbi:MAG: DUF2187 domain-containing protein [Vagococcus sp.]